MESDNPDREIKILKEKLELQIKINKEYNDRVSKLTNQASDLHKQLLKEIRTYNEKGKYILIDSTLMIVVCIFYVFTVGGNAFKIQHEHPTWWWIVLAAYMISYSFFSIKGKVKYARITLRIYLAVMLLVSIRYCLLGIHFFEWLFGA